MTIVNKKAVSLFVCVAFVFIGIGVGSGAEKKNKENLKEMAS